MGVNYFLRLAESQRQLTLDYPYVCATSCRLLQLSAEIFDYLEIAFWYVGWY